MGFFKKAFDFVVHPTHSRTFGLVIMFVFIAAISLTVYVSQQQQQTKQRASGIDAFNQCFNESKAKFDACKIECGPEEPAGSIDRTWINCVENTCTPPFQDRNIACNNFLTPTPGPELALLPPIPTSTPTPNCGNEFCGTGFHCVTNNSEPAFCEKDIIPTPTPTKTIVAVAQPQPIPTSAPLPTRPQCPPPQFNITNTTETSLTFKTTTSLFSGVRYTFILSKTGGALLPERYEFLLTGYGNNAGAGSGGTFNRLTPNTNYILFGNASSSDASATCQAPGLSSTAEVTTLSPNPLNIYCGGGTACPTGYSCDLGKTNLCKKNTSSSSTLCTDGCSPGYTCNFGTGLCALNPTPKPTYANCSTTGCPNGYFCKTDGPNKYCSPNPPTPTPTPILTPAIVVVSCPLKSKGDANCDGKIDIADLEAWKAEFLGTTSTKTADFNTDRVVDLLDFNIWRNGLLGR